MWRVPFFNPLQRWYYEETVNVVERHMKAYSVTRDGVVCPPTAPPEQQEQSFHLNAQKVEGCEAMVAILDYLGVDLVVQKQRTTEEGVALPEMDYIPIMLPDSGTVWEMGAAYIIGKPVIGLLVTPAKLNLMLARGTVSTAGSLKELDEQLGMIVPVLNNVEEYAKVVVELKSKQWEGEIV